MRNEEGYLIITVMLILCLLSIMGISAVRTSNTELAIATNHQIHSMNFYAAESGISVGPIYALATDDDDNPLYPETEWGNIDYLLVGDGALSNGTSYEFSVLPEVNNYEGTMQVMRYGDEDGDYLPEVNYTTGRPFIKVISTGTHKRGGQAMIEARFKPTPPFVIPEAALWVHSNVNGNGVSGSVVGEGPSDDSIFGKDYYDSDYSCSAVPDIKYHVAMPNIDYDGNTGENQLYEQTTGLYPLALMMDNFKEMADEYILDLPGNKFPAETDFTDSLIVIDMEDAKVSQNIEGSGILVVTGNLEISGNLKWKGLVLVNGNVTFNGGGASNATMVEGSVIALGDAIAINGSVDIVYNCNVIADLYDHYYRYKMRSWRQL